MCLLRMASLTGGKRVSLSTSMFDGCVATGHPICIVNMSHVTVIIGHNCRFYRDLVFIAIIASSGWIMNVCQEVHVSLVPPHRSCQVISDPYSNVTPFQSTVLGFRSLGMQFLYNITVPQQNFFSWPKRQTCQGRKISCPRTVNGRILLLPLSDLSPWRGLLSGIVPSVVSLYRGKHSYHMYIK
jgi:hypothetical protein